MRTYTYSLANEPTIHPNDHHTFESSIYPAIARIYILFIIHLPDFRMSDSENIYIYVLCHIGQYVYEIKHIYGNGIMYIK